MLILRHKIRNTQSYVSTFLLSNGSNTLEAYILKIFFPRYFLWLFLCFSLLVLNHIYYNWYNLIVYGIIFGLLISVRIFNRTIFSTIWHTVGNNG